MVDSSDLKKSTIDFYEAVGKHYPEEEVVYNSLRGKLRRKFVERWLSEKKGFLLDIGTGEGVYLRSYKGERPIGVDISISKLYKAKERLPESLKEKCKFVAADAEMLGCFKAESFDIILCSELIEHLVNSNFLWESIRRLLRPGGCSLVTCPLYRKKRPTWISLGILQDYGIPGMYGKSYYHAAFKPEELESFAKSYGLEVVEKGTLEREVRIAVAIPVILFRIIDIINRLTFKSSAADRWNQRLISQGSLFMHHLIRFSGIQPLLLCFVRQGVRSYIVVQKPYDSNGQ